MPMAKRGVEGLHLIGEVNMLNRYGSVITMSVVTGAGESAVMPATHLAAMVDALDEALGAFDHPLNQPVEVEGADAVGRPSRRHVLEVIGRAMHKELAAHGTTDSPTLSEAVLNALTAEGLHRSGWEA